MHAKAALLTLANGPHDAELGPLHLPQLSVCAQLHTAAALAAPARPGCGSRTGAGAASRQYSKLLLACQHRSY